MDKVPLRKIVESGTVTVTLEWVRAVKKSKFNTTTWKRVEVSERRILRLECGHTTEYATNRTKKRVRCYRCETGTADLYASGKHPIVWDGEIK